MADLLTSDGVRLAVDVTGPDDAPAVVLVHGLAASVDIGWRAIGVLDRLAGAGLRVVAFDARGHGRSDAPHDPARYGDERAAADLIEVLAAFASPAAVVAAYSMGSATALWALAAGAAVRAAVLGAVPAAVLEWSAGDDALATTAVAVLEGREAPDAAMQWWVDFLDATGADRLALAALLRRHRPVVEHWEAITAPIVVATGVDDPGAAPAAALVARLADVRAIDLPGDHVRAAASTEFSDAVIDIAFE
jgi:pimeloyl-ACP methyl ester carboxylesterase